MKKIFLSVFFLSIFVDSNAQPTEESIHDAASCSEATYKRMKENGTFKGEIPNCARNLRVLLDNGADSNEKGRHKQTPLHIAAKWGNLELARILLDSGALVDEVDIDSQTPLMIAMKNYILQKYNESRNMSYSQGSALPVIQLLLKYHANPNTTFPGGFYELHADRVPYTSGYTALTLAARHCWVEVAQSLLEEGADPELPRADGATPEYLSRYHKCNDVLSLVTKPKSR